MLAGGKRWVPRFEFQRNEHYGKRRRTLLPARHLHRRRPRLQIDGRKNSKIGRRRSEHKTRRTVNQDVVRVSIAAEAVAHDFKAVAKRSHARSQRYLQGGGRRFHRWNNGACDSASAPLNRGINLLGIQRRDKHCAAGCVRLQCVSVGELHYDSGSEAPVDIENSQRGVFTADNLARHDQNTCARGWRRLLRWEVLSNQRKQGEGEPELFEGVQGDGHTEIVEEFSLTQKGEEAGQSWARACHAPVEFGYSCKIDRRVSVRYRKVISWMQSLSE